MPKFLDPLVMGNPKLLLKSEEVTNIQDPEIQSIISDMLYTVQTIGERVGLAAPQVGIMKRIIVFRIPKNLVNERYKNIASDNQEELPWHALINPFFEPLSDQIQSGWEACISVPGLMGKVDRYNHIKYSFYDERGQLHHKEARDFHARVVQHEIDHLDGILFPMKVKNMAEFGYESEIVKHL